MKSNRNLKQDIDLSQNKNNKNKKNAREKLSMQKM